MTRLRTAGVVVEDWLSVDRPTIARWESGTERIPSLRVRQVKWLLKVEENTRTREAAGLDDCEWVVQQKSAFAALVEPTLRQIGSFSAEIREHGRSCRTCLENETWARQHLTDPGHYPLQPGLWGRALGLLHRIPSALVPASIGAAILGVIVLVKLPVVVALALVGALSGEIGTATAATLPGMGVLAVVAAAAAGAAGGLVFTLVRPWLRSLGAVGDYLTAILVVWAYGFAICLAAPLALGEPILGKGDVPFVLIYGGLLGAFCAFMYRRDEARRQGGRMAENR